MTTDSTECRRHDFTVMGGPAQFRAFVRPGCSHAFATAQTELQRLEARFSRYRDDSITSEINAAAGSGRAVAVDTETAALLDYAQTLWQQSEGLFDLTSGPLRRIWDFKRGNVPEQPDIESTLETVGWEKLKWDGESIELPVAGMELDFGGIVKEYASDAAARILAEHGLYHALVDLAGDIAVTGPQADGSAWTVGVRNPNDSANAVATTTLGTGALATSGDYERCFVLDGRRYSHLLNPRTGWPVDGLASVTVKAPQCLIAGSAASTAILLGQDRGLAWLADFGLPWFAVDQSGQVYGDIAV